MNARTAKLLRRAIYNKGHHPGPVIYGRHPKTGAIISDAKRQGYQRAKQAYLLGLMVK